jgi:hypothetical protein
MCLFLWGTHQQPTGLYERTFPTPFVPQPVKYNTYETDDSLHYFGFLATKEKEGKKNTIQFPYGRIPHTVFEGKDCRAKGII